MIGPNPNLLPPPAAMQAQELTVNDLWSILRRRKRVVLGVFLCMLALGMTLFTLRTRRYEATAEIQVQKDSADALGLDNMMAATSAGEEDSLAANINLQTQAQVIQSKSLALQVIKELDLEHTSDFQPHFTVIGWLLNLLPSSGPAEPANGSIDTDPGRRTRAIKMFESKLRVKPVAGTRLIEVSYLSSDPQIAAKVVNRLVQDLIDFNFQTRHDATKEAGDWLGTQLATLRKQSEDLQEKVVVLQRDSGVFTLGQIDSQGREQVYTPVLDRLQQATSQLTQAQQARILKGALYQVVKSGNPELISGLAGSGMLSAAPDGTSGALSLLQGLRAQEATKQADLDALSAKFGPGYPKLEETKASLAGIQNSISSEAARIASRIKNDYAMSEQVEESARAAFLNEKQKAEALNNKAIEYELVRQEALQSRNLYENLRRRLQEADVVSGLRSSNIIMVDQARVPAKPATPNPILYTGVSTAGGFLLGVIAALLLDAADHSIKDVSEMEALGMGAPFGFLPFYDSGRRKKLLARPAGTPPSISTTRPVPALVNTELIALADPRCAYTEAVRALRTSLMVPSLRGQAPKVVLITSSDPGEGKSMLSANLAVLYAQRGKKVLLVDGDLRTPILHERLNLSNDRGLASILSDGHVGQYALGFSEPFPGVPSLHVLPAGPSPEYPAELLASDQMNDLVHAWRKEYDYVIIDGAPLIPVTDSAILSDYADISLVVARYGVTDRRALDRSLTILRAQGTTNVGLVLNAVTDPEHAGYGYYGERHASYYQVNAHA